METKHVISLKEICIRSISRSIPADVCLLGKNLLPHLLPADMLDIVDSFIVMHGSQVNVCPYELLLPCPSRLLETPQLRVKLHKIFGHAWRAKASRCSRDLLLNGIERTNLAQLGPAGLLDLGAFLCETGWYDDGTAILEKIHHMTNAATSPQHSIIAIDSAQRLLAAAVTVGHVENARRWNDRVIQLVGHHRGTLAASARVSVARFCVLVEQWSDAARWLLTAADCLPDAVPLDVAVELSRTAAELQLARHRPAGLAELARQAATLAFRQLGGRHPLTLSTAQLLADCTIANGLYMAGLQLSTWVMTVTEEMFGADNPLTQRAMLNRTVARSRAASEVAVDIVPPSADDLDNIQPSPCSSWFLDKILVECLWMDEKIPSLLRSSAGRTEAQRLSYRIVTQLTMAAARCEAVFGPHSLRLARILTELGHQYFSSAIDGLVDLLGWDVEKCNEQAEQALRHAAAIQSSRHLPPDHRELLVTQVTLGCLYTYSNMQLLHQAERIFRSTLEVCYVSGRRQHLDLVEHCLRGMANIYEQHEDAARAHSTAQLLETVSAQRRLLLGQRLPAGGLASLLAPCPCSDRQLVARVRSALAEPAAAGAPQRRQAAAGATPPSPAP